MTADASGGIAPVLIPGWGAEFPWLMHGFSTRAGGDSVAYSATGAGELNLGLTAEDDSAVVSRNRERWVAHVAGPGQPQPRLYTLRQVHSAVIHRVGAANAHAGEEGDGLITDEAGALLGVGTADCVPVLVVDPEHRAVGAFHAGWRGTVEAIVARGVRAMKDEFGSRPEQLRAAIGPAIGVCCYQVGEEVLDRFRYAYLYADQLFQEGSRLDLVEANRRQLVWAGLRAENIAQTGLCTQCHPEQFFSYRGQGGRTGRMLSVVGVRS